MPKQTFFNLNRKKRLRIIRAALTEFAEHGYQNANLDRIVSKAGIPKGSLYQYFENKEDFFIFTARDSLEKAWSLLHEYMSNSPPSDCFDMFAKTLLFLAELRRAEPEIALIYIRAGFLQGHALQSKILPEIYQKNDIFWERFFSWGIEDGLIDRHVDEKAAKFLLDAVSNRFQEKLFLNKYHDGKDFSSRPGIETFVMDMEVLLRKAMGRPTPQTTKGE